MLPPCRPIAHTVGWEEVSKYYCLCFCVSSFVCALLLLLLLLRLYFSLSTRQLPLLLRYKFALSHHSQRCFVLTKVPCSTQHFFFFAIHLFLFLFVVELSYSFSFFLVLLFLHPFSCEEKKSLVSSSSSSSSKKKNSTTNNTNPKFWFDEQEFPTIYPLHINLEPTFDYGIFGENQGMPF